MAKKAKEDGSEVAGNGPIERLPHFVILEIMARLDLESLCSTAPVCRTFSTLASQAVSSISILDLSTFTPDVDILRRIIQANCSLRSLTLDCRLLDDSSVKYFAKGSIQELVLLKCRLFSACILTTIAQACPKLRLFKLEATFRCNYNISQSWKQNIDVLLTSCSLLETFWLKLSGEDVNRYDTEAVKLVLPNTMKDLLLQPLCESQAKKLFLKTPLNSAFPYVLAQRDFNLRSLSLVLNVITDQLLVLIVSNLPLLTDLCLEDRPSEEPSNLQDLTNSGLQQLVSNCKLTCLSLTRSRQYCSATFKRVNDMGMFLLAEGCNNLESIRLGGFSKVTDAGYVSILLACKNLRRLEIVNAFFLSDLAFHNLSHAPCSVVDLKLVSCNLLTCEAAGSLSMSGGLEVLDLSGCKSIGDKGLVSVSKLCKLTTLDLGGADITDSGLLALGNGTSPICSLSIRGCKRVTDRGIRNLLLGSGNIGEILSKLDMGFMPGITDMAIFTIAEICKVLRDLCLRNCFHITDASVEALGSMESSNGSKRSLRKLDLYQCTGLSRKSYRLLAGPPFLGLRWLGVGRNSPSHKCYSCYTKMAIERPWVCVCLIGCEMDCKDGWHGLGHA